MSVKNHVSGPGWNRRRFLGGTAAGLGALAVESLLRAGSETGEQAAAAMPPGPTLPVRAKRAIWLFMAGGPSHLDLFDYKPGLKDRFDQDVPPSVIGSRTSSTMTSGQSRFPVAPSAFAFSQHGQSGLWVSELLPWTAKLADDIAVIKTISAESVNHDPAMLSMMTGAVQAGKPSVGSWLSYGLGSMNQNLPTFVVMTSLFSQHVLVQALLGGLWGSGFLPSVHAAVPVRSPGEPVAYLANPAGVPPVVRRDMLDALGTLNRRQSSLLGDAETASRIEQYEMAFRMQSAVPDLVDLGGESDATRALYGDSVNTPGSFAANCLLARRMLERDVRFVQIYHRGWDAHFQLPTGHRAQCGDIDQACHGLVTDLKQRGLLDDTLVIWGGEFGRTVYSQGDLSATDYGRDHHPFCFSMWMAGAGVQPGITYGETDDYGFNPVSNPVPLRDLHATVLRQFGLDHNALGVRYQGLFQRLVGVDKPAQVVSGILKP